MDKNRIIVDYLLQCPTIQKNPLFFNFAQIESGNTHIITEQDITKKPYIDGSVLKQYTFSIASYSSVSHNAVVNGETIADENIANMAKVQEILDWINEQADNGNYPDFGPNCVVDEMTTLTSDPDVDGIDTSVNPPIARYSIGVKIVYLDNSKKIGN
jgi:hypothetical protein